MIAGDGVNYPQVVRLQFESLLIHRQGTVRAADEIEKPGNYQVRFGIFRRNIDRPEIGSFGRLTVLTTEIKIAQFNKQIRVLRVRCQRFF